VGLLGGLFNQFKKGLKRTQELVLAPMGRLLGLRRLDEAQLEELEDLLLQADLGVKAVDQLMARLRTELKGGTDIDPKRMQR
jgi:fused signal recognition particle receptor